MELSPEGLREFFGTVLPHLNEKQRRVVAGAMVLALGRGGQARVAEASGLSTSTVNSATQQVRTGVEPSGRQRTAGGGDKPAVDKQPGLLEALDELVHPSTRGTPMSALRWTLKSTYELARDLQAKGFKVSAELVRRLLHQMGYSLQAPAKQNEGTSHPDRDGQFRYLDKLIAERLDRGEPVVSVDTKKKELIGNYANGGREWQPSGDPERTNVHDFADRALGEFAKAIPYGVYDIGNDEGWVSVGDSARHRRVRRRVRPPVVEHHGQGQIPQGHHASDHGRLRGLQRRSAAGLEVAPGPLRGRDRAHRHRLPLPAGHLEVEPHRAPSVRLHLHQLAGAGADRHPHDRRAHRRHQDEGGPVGPVRL